LNIPGHLTKSDIEKALKASLVNFSVMNDDGSNEQAEYIHFLEEGDQREYCFKIPHYSQWGVNWDFAEVKKPEEQKIQKNLFSTQG
jgi:hypothetical protein